MDKYVEILDGTNVFRKTWLAGQLGAFTGFFASTYHVALYSPETYLEGLTRVAKSTVTMATLGAVFAASSCISAELRDAPEDPMNYFIGGCASGILIGARTFPPKNGFLMIELDDNTGNIKHERDSIGWTK
ncbi:hypothetical protein E2320_021922, partial [Naja naja]